MNIELFDYLLPAELIAQHPIRPRDHSRLLILDRSKGTIDHRHFHDLPEFVRPGDVLVLNDTRVFKAKLTGHRKSLEGSAGKVELLLLRPVPEDPKQWEALAKPGRRSKKGTTLSFGEGRLQAEVLDHKGDGVRIFQFQCEEDFHSLIDEIGEVPLPPYIHSSVKDEEEYQTVYARHRGSVAAPTAGFHFTPELLAHLRSCDIQIATLTLHVGLGTFQPLRVDNLEDHQMHEEFFEISPNCAEILNATKARGGRIVAVGTTVTRTLESTVQPNGTFCPSSGTTKLFIRPGYHFQAVDVLLTNFHLPRTTLLVLVCAFAGRDLIIKCYGKAVQERYRFFSFGDAMLIL